MSVLISEFKLSISSFMNWVGAVAKSQDLSHFLAMIVSKNLRKGRVLIFTKGSANQLSLRSATQKILYLRFNA